MNHLKRIFNGRLLALGLLLFTVGAVPSFALGTSPVGLFLQGAAAEATNLWANLGAAVGLVVGLLGCLFGSHRVKEWCTEMAIVCVCLLSVNGLIAWLV